jgi:arsenite methyltransferase
MIIVSNKEEKRELIRNNYSQVALKGSGGCCGSPKCCGSDSTFNVNAATKELGYSEEDLQNMPDQANMGLGCGNPIAIASLQEGDTVLDLGSGGGFDCFLARR